MKFITPFFLLLWFSMNAPAAVYKCTDANNKIEFSDKPCPNAESVPMDMAHVSSGDAVIGALQDQVAMGKVVPGMTSTQVRQAWGEPLGTKSSKKKNGTKEIWTYQRESEAQQVEIVNGKVESVSSTASPIRKAANTMPLKKAGGSATMTVREQKADARRFIREGMTASDVRAQIGTPDEQGPGSCREQTTLNAKKQMKATRTDCEKCWTYAPAENDPQTQTRVCFRKNKVSSVQRSVVRQ